MTGPAKRTQPPVRHERPAGTTTTDQERAAIRQADSDDTRRSRAPPRTTRTDRRPGSRRSPHRDLARRARRRQTKAQTAKGNPQHKPYARTSSGEDR